MNMPGAYAIFGKQACTADSGGKAVSLIGGLMLRRLLRNPAAYNWAKLYFTVSPAERMHELLRDVLSVKLGWKPDDVSHVFVIIGVKPGVNGGGVKVTSGACTHYSGPVGECRDPAHLAIGCQEIIACLEEANPDLPERIDRSRASLKRPQPQ
jgi:hypothetical protein